MPKFVIHAVVTLGLLLSVSAEAQQVQYVGNSKGPNSSPRSGGAGIIELNDECVLTFGDGARMCSSLEIIRTFQSGTIPERDTGPATQNRKWVAPSIVAGSSTAIDASGITASGAQLTCNGWSSASSTFKGLTIDTDGKFTLQTCNSLRNVACCMPVP
jgi:hypothetical protein